MKSPNIEAILQKIKQSTEKQRELEAEQVKTFDKLNNARSNKIEEVPSLQSQLRELEKKVELERVQYEELMLELSLTKRHGHDKEREELNINSSQLPLYTPASSIFSVGQITSYNSLSQSSTPVPTTSSITAPTTALYNNNIRDHIDEVSAINNINAMLAQATSSIRNENDSLLAGLGGG